MNYYCNLYFFYLCNEWNYCKEYVMKIADKTLICELLIVTFAPLLTMISVTGAIAQQKHQRVKKVLIGHM